MPNEMDPRLRQMMLARALSGYPSEGMASAPSAPQYSITGTPNTPQMPTLPAQSNAPQVSPMFGGTAPAGSGNWRNSAGRSDIRGMGVSRDAWAHGNVPSATTWNTSMRQRFNFR